MGSRLNARVRAADDAHVTADFLCGCGFSSASAAPRCRACPQLSVAQHPVAGQFGSLATAPAERTGQISMTRGAQPALVRYSRWEKSDGTFGPFGRVFATFLLLIPLPVLAVTLAIGIGIIGLGIYVVVIMPWALRDIWKKATIRLDMGAQAPTGPRFS
jgi:hypothetical protein